MHKNLDAVRCAYQKMKAACENGGPAPVLLPNGDNAAVLDVTVSGQGDSGSNEQATSSSMGGAIKLAGLAGALLNHRDDKKG